MPNQIVRFLQLGRIEKGLKSSTIWECISCQTCTSRCPQSVDCAGIMDALRQKAFEQGVTITRQMRTVQFYRSFLNNIRRYGRVRELELVGLYKMAAFSRDLNVPLLLKDSSLGPRLMQKGKLHLLGESVRDREVVRRIFQRCFANETLTEEEEG